MIGSHVICHPSSINWPFNANESCEYPPFQRHHFFAKILHILGCISKNTHQQRGAATMFVCVVRAPTDAMKWVARMLRLLIAAKYLGILSHVQTGCRHYGRRPHTLDTLPFRWTTLSHPSHVTVGRCRVLRQSSRNCFGYQTQKVLFLRLFVFSHTWSAMG